MIRIEDNIHCEVQGTFASFDEALAELQRRAKLPWNAPPNAAPCSSSPTCGREYEICEYDNSQSPWKSVRRVTVLWVSAKEVRWADNFRTDWEQSLPEQSAPS